MFTLKIKWFRSEHNKGIVDENTLFFLADSIEVGSEIKSLSELKAWEADSFMDYSIASNDEGGNGEVIGGTRMIQVRKDNKSTWYLASLAWLLSPEGKTIERLTT